MTNFSKKLLSMFLAFLMVVGMVQVTAFAEETATVTMVSNTEGALKPGDTFTVSANISDNPGFSAADLYFSVSEGITITAVSNTDCLMNSTNGMFMTSDALDMLAYVATGDKISGNGTMFQLVCQVDDDAVAGTYSVNVNSAHAKHNFTGEDENYDTYTINATFIAAEVIVETEPAVIAVTGVTLDKETLEFTLGSEALSDTLTATVAPEDAANKNIVWSTSDANVATVESGTVTAVGEGTATITVTTEDGSFTDTCNVTVNPAPVTINADHADMNVSVNTVTSGQTVQVMLSVENDEDAASVYNSYEFIVEYDSTKLTYQSFSCADTNCAVVSGENGNLTINGYGEIKTVSEDAFVTLNFVAASVEEEVTAEVKLTNAYRDTSAMAIERDIDEIDVETASKTITIQPTTKEYKVTFSEAVKINNEELTEETVPAGESVTFYLKTEGREGQAATVPGATQNADGSYTVTPTEDTTVTIEWKHETFNVTIKDGTTQTTDTATHGTDYPFTVSEKVNYILNSVKYQIGNGEEILLGSTTGEYKIPGDKILGDIVITITRTYDDSGSSPTEYTVTYYKNGVESGSEKKASGTTLTVNADEGYVIYQIDNTKLDQVAETYNLTVSADVAVYMGQKYTVTLPEDGTVDGDAEANYGSDYTFTIDDGHELGEVTINGQPVTPTRNDDDSYTIHGDQITGAIVITTKAIVYVDSVAVYDYVKTEDATVIQLVVATAKEGALAEGEILQYKDKDTFKNMFWSPNYNGYAYLVAVGESEDLLTSETAASNIGKASATATTVSYNGNVNKTATDVVDVNDAQLVYDIYKAMYNNFDKVSMEKMLRADMNANSTDAEATYGLTVNDVASVMAIVNAK